jgi:hypothetical protein
MLETPMATITKTCLIINPPKQKWNSLAADFWLPSPPSAHGLSRLAKPQTLKSDYTAFKPQGCTRLWETNLNTEVTEILNGLCVVALKGRRTRRSPFWLRPPGGAMNGGAGTLACVLCMGCTCLGHGQECLCHQEWSGGGGQAEELDGRLIVTY